MSSGSAHRRRAVYEDSHAQLRGYIRAEELGPGDRLPPERALAKHLGVSRTTLRQALTVLRVEGLIDIRHGTGIYLLRSIDDTVPPITAELRATHPELPELGEVGNSLEALAARLAAARRTDDDIAAMGVALETMQREIDEGSDGLDGDRLFHAAVVRAAGNPVLVDLLAAIAAGAERIARASLGRIDQPPRSLATHRLILAAICDGDGETAQRLMHEHLEITGEIAGDPPELSSPADRDCSGRVGVGGGTANLVRIRDAIT